MQWLEQYGQAAGYISAILGLVALILVKPVKRWVHKRKEAKKKAQKEQAEFRKELRDSLSEITTALGGLSDDIGDLQYERLSQAQDFYTSRDGARGQKKRCCARCMHPTEPRGGIIYPSTTRKRFCGLADKPEKEEDA